MPNHVDMDLKVTGNVESLRAFLDFAQEEDNLLSANKFIPYPEEYKKADEETKKIRKECQANGDWSKYTGVKDGFNSGGYEWCCKNWGTKWGIYSTELLTCKLEGKKGNLMYNCQSAWSPPLPVITAMSQKFPALKFTLKYYERGCAFKGVFVVAGGETLKESTSSYSGSRGG